MAAQIPKKTLMAKARGFTASIEKMNEKERAITPSGEYGDDYNNFRDLVAVAYPHLKPLLPPPVETFFSSDTRHKYTRQRYGEINTFCEQMFQLLSEEE